MRGTRAKAIRRQARAECDPSIVQMIVRSKLTRKAEFMKDAEGNVIIDVKNGLPLELVPEQRTYTAFWPTRAFRRVVKSIKRGRAPGAYYHG